MQVTSLNPVVLTGQGGGGSTSVGLNVVTGLRFPFSSSAGYEPFVWTNTSGHNLITQLQERFVCKRLNCRHAPLPLNKTIG